VPTDDAAHRGVGTTLATSWPAVFMALASGVLAAFQIGKVIIGLPEVRVTFPMGLGTAGLLLSSYTIVGAVLGATTGAVLERVGRHRALVGSLAILTAGALLGTVAWSVPVLLVSRVVEGFGFMGVVVAAPAIINGRTAPAHRRLALGIWAVYMPLGQALVIAAGPLVLGPGGWRALWGINTALLLVCTVAAAVVLPPRRPALPPRASRRRLLSLDVGRGTWLLAAAFCVYALQYLAVVGFLPSIYGSAGMPAASAGALTAVVIAGNVLGNLAAGALLHRGAHAGSLMAVASLAMGLSGVAIYNARVGFAVSFAGAMVFATAGGLLPASVYGAVPTMARTPAAAAASNGILVQAANLGSIVGPPAVGLLAAATGSWQLSPVLLSTCAGLALLAAVRVRRLERSARAAGH
jgi:MFS family permease